MSGVGLRSRGYSGPRWGTFSGKAQRRSSLARGLAKGGLLRSWDWQLNLATFALTGLGVVLVWAATAPQLLAGGADPHYYLERAIVWAVLGIALMFVTSSIDYRRYRRWAPAIYGLAVLLLLAVLVAGQSVNGAKAWIQLPGGFQIEPSEFAKLGIVVPTAAILSRQPAIGGGSKGRPTLKTAGLAILAAAPSILLVEREPALGVMLVLVFILAIMIVMSGIRLYWVGLGAAISVAAIYLAVKAHVLKSYQVSRLTSFLHPQSNLSGAGYNAYEARIAVGSGGLHGTGLFHGTFTAGNYVPSSSTDFIFTVAGEELGFIGCAVIVALLGFVVFRAIRIAQRTDDLFGMLVAVGVAAWFAFQSFVNIGMTLGIMPITGLPLPFISYGGSAIFADMIAIGLLQSVRRHHSVFSG